MSCSASRLSAQARVLRVAGGTHARPCVQRAQSGILPSLLRIRAQTGLASRDPPLGCGVGVTLAPQRAILMRRNELKQVILGYTCAATLVAHQLLHHNPAWQSAAPSRWRRRCTRASACCHAPEYQPTNRRGSGRVHFCAKPKPRVLVADLTSSGGAAERIAVCTARCSAFGHVLRRVLAQLCSPACPCALGLDHTAVTGTAAARLAVRSTWHDRLCTVGTGPVAVVPGRSDGESAEPTAHLHGA